MEEKSGTLFRFALLTPKINGQLKAHLVIKLNQPVKESPIPYWVDFINDKSKETRRFSNSLDDIFQRNQTPIWITQEYQPGGPAGAFNEEEIKAGLNRVYRIILRDRYLIPESLLKEIGLNPLVEWIRPISVGSAEMPAPSRGMTIHDDRARTLISLPYAHRLTRGDPRIKIAVLDTGVDTSHPELERAVAQKADFVNLEGLDTTDFVGDFMGHDAQPDDEVGHGTHVCGIIAGRGRKMPVGVAPDCKILAVRVLASLKQGDKVVGAGLIDNINTGIKWAIDQGADIINMSLGIRHEHGGLPHAEIVRYALGKGITVIAAAGNDGSRDKYYPGALPGVIAVGAVDGADHIAPYSTYGAHISIVAPGDQIYSSYKDKGYAFSSGTSQAAPFVSGGVALLKALALGRGVGLKDRQVKYLLKHSSDKHGKIIRSEKTGYGRLNLQDAMKLLTYLLT